MNSSVILPIYSYIYETFNKNCDNFIWKMYLFLFLSPSNVSVISDILYHFFEERFII